MGRYLTDVFFLLQKREEDIRGFQLQENFNCVPCNVMEE